MGPKSPGPGQARPVHQAVLGPPVRPAGRHGTARQNDLGPVQPGHSNGRPAPPGLPRACQRSGATERPRPRQPGSPRRPKTTPPALYDPAGAPSPTLTLIPIHSRPALGPACHPLRRRSDSAVARRASPRWTSPRRLVLHRRVATSSSPLYPSPSPRPRPFAHLCPPRRRHPRRRPPSSLSSSITPASGSGFAGKYILLKTSTPLSNPSCLTLTLTLATSSSQ